MPSRGCAFALGIWGLSSPIPAVAAPTAAQSEPRERADVRWVDRWAPERNQVELGPFVGVLVTPRTHELFEPQLDVPGQGFARLRRIAPELGLRLGYFPLRYVGAEVEGAAMFSRAETTDERASLYAVRGHVVGQLPCTITPFAVVGAGALGVRSARSAVGSDVDAALHFGLGAKLYLGRSWSVRIDLRDTLTPRRGVGEGATQWIEVTAGLGLVLGRKRSEEPANTAASRPAPARDTDGDGWLDPDDGCVEVPGVAPDGCPPPPDTDGDGFIDEVDLCPDAAGIEPNGCPDLDSDRDGILVDADACPEEPETHNGFEDADGCPDEVPPEVVRFEGTLVGVNFPIDSAELGDDSRNVLDAAVEVLTRFPDIRVEISGHTDATGAREHNLTLSDARAEAVSAYLVEQGIDAARIESRGAGPDEPIDSNATAAGRANNRRIEFRVLR